MTTKKDGQAPGRPRVLIVEDEFVILLSLKVQLAAIGCEVVGTAREADAAVDLARTLRPDIVLMDLGLPGKDGAEATSAIMSEAPTQIILVTAYGDDRVDRALEAGARVVLTKPIVQEQLAKAIAEVTGAAAGQ
jgi:response regulator NasT